MRHDELDERHEREQYFFDDDTRERLAGLLTGWDAPCCLCAPQVGRALVARRHPVTILDVDERFADLPGFRRFDLGRPEWSPEVHDVVLCDPPFHGLSLGRLRDALLTLVHHDPTRPLLITYLVRRADAFLDALQPFDLRPTGFRPGYATVEDVPRNAIELFSNLPAERLTGLRAP